MADYVPTAIYDLLTDPSAPAGLTDELGSPMRVYPITMSEIEGYPAIVYAELSSVPIASKDGGEPVEWTLMLDIMGLSYLQVRKIDRLAREALNLKTIDVDEVGTVKLKYAESEDMPYVDEKNIFHLGRTYRAIKI
jgi:hypothetical protein